MSWYKKINLKISFYWFIPSEKILGFYNSDNTYKTYEEIAEENFEITGEREQDKIIELAEQLKPIDIDGITNIIRDLSAKNLSDAIEKMKRDKNYIECLLWPTIVQALYGANSESEAVYVARDVNKVLENSTLCNNRLYALEILYILNSIKQETYDRPDAFAEITDKINQGQNVSWKNIIRKFYLPVSNFEQEKEIVDKTEELNGIFG